MPIRRSWPASLLALALLLGTGRAEPPDDLPHRTMPFAVRDTNAAKFALREAHRLLAEGRTAQGLRTLQRVLDELRDDFYRVGSSEESTRWRLAADEARDLLAGLGADERDLYERLSRPSTGPMLEKALRLRDQDVLGEIALRFGATLEGVEAMRILADLALEDGRPRDAAYWARFGLRYAPDDAGLWFRRIDALGTARDRAALEALVPPDGVVQEGQTAAARRQTWLDRLQAPDPLPGWPMWGGDLTHTETAPSAGPKPSRLRWARQLPFNMSLLDRDPLRGGFQDREAYFLEAWDAYRPFHPVVVDRVVYLADGRSLSALDLYSGVELWSFDSDRPSGLQALLIPRGAPNPGRTALDRAFAPTVVGDLLIGTVEIRHAYDQDMLQGVEISTYLPRRVVVALHRATGELAWVMETEVDDELGVVSPPIVAEGLVVCVTSRYEGNHHVFLTAFDLTTGRKAWQRSLGWGQQELNLFGEPVKELAAPVPAVAEGLVYASTGLGFVAAVELHTGRPVWLASYEIQPIEAVDFWYTAPLRFPRVAAAPIVAHGDLLLVAPPDGMHLSAFDRRDGTLRWRAPYPRTVRLGTPASFLGVAHDGRRSVALLTGADLVAYDVETGERVWMGRLQDEYGEQNLPIGTGAVTKDEVLIPTNRGLVRFSLAREGSFEGRDPWPIRVEAGNLLPLSQVLLVTTRNAIQAFYSWEEIERDIAERRRARPDDPTILLEAGEIYRLGGALDRAESAFREAREMAQARPALAEALRRAEQGLYRTWTTAGDRLAADKPEESRRAYERALSWARDAHELVETRVRIDALLEGLPDERVQNLERLADESAGVRAQFPGSDEEVPARAMALLKLAQVQLDRDRPREALDALQRLLREEPDAQVGGTPARTIARRQVDEILRVWGRALYESHEERARGLLEQATGSRDADLLARILREYPNAAVVPEALLGLGREALAAGRSLESADVLRRLLAEHPDSPHAVEAAVWLARAYDRAGLDGGRAFAVRWLAQRYPQAEVTIDGARRTVAEIVASMTRPPRIPLPPETGTLRTPLRDVHFARVEDDSWGRQIDVSASGGATAPLALLTDGRMLTAFDLVGGRLAFELDCGPCHRAWYDDGVLVLALSRSLRGVTADTGQTLWEVELEGSVLELRGLYGQAYVLVHDTTQRRGNRHLLAVDASRGRTLWRLELGGEADFRDLVPHGAEVLLREARYQAGRVWPAMLVVDALAGRLRHVIGLPAEGLTEGEPVPVGDALVVAAKDNAGARYLVAHALSNGETLWNRPLPGTGRVCALLGEEDRLVVLQSDGSLGTYRADNGWPLDETRIFAGENADACSFHGTAPLLDGDRLVLMPRPSSPPFHVGAWSRKTGKLLWDAPFPEPQSPSRSSMQLADGHVLALTPYTPTRQEARVLLRVVDAKTGEEKQRIEPVGLTAEYGLVSMASGWGSVVVFGRAGAALYTR